MQMREIVRLAPRPASERWRLGDPACGCEMMNDVRDLAFAKSLDIDAAYRFSDYSTSGATNTWNVAVNYAITSDVKVRGSTARAVNCHVYGGNIHDQPNKSPGPIVSIITGLPSPSLDSRTTFPVSIK